MVAAEGQPARRPHGRPQAVRGALERGSAHHAQLPGALRSGHLRPGLRHQGVRRHHRRPVLHRPRAPPSTRSTSAPPPAAACCRPPTTPTTRVNVAPDDVSGFNVNTIAIEIPIALLTSDLRRHTDSEPARGARHLRHHLASADHRAAHCRAKGRQPDGQGPWRQVQRMGNPLINELIIGTGSKDRFSMENPTNDAAVRAVLRASAAGRHLRSRLACPIPAGRSRRSGAARRLRRPDDSRRHAARPDRRPAPPQHRHSADPGRAAAAPRPAHAARQATRPTTTRRASPTDGVPTTTWSTSPPAPWPASWSIPTTYGTRIGDGVNVNDMPKRATFPYVPPAHDGRNSRHVDPNEPGCAGVCPPDCSHVSAGRLIMTTIELMLAAAVMMAGSAQALSAQPSPPSPPSASPSRRRPAHRPRCSPQPGMETPAERKMAIARKKIARDPKHFHGYNELALALTQRARETRGPALLPPGRRRREDVAGALARQLRGD